MRFVVEKEEFVKGLGIVSRVALGRQSAGARSVIRIKAEEGGLELWATDLDLTVRNTVDAQSEAGGEAVVPARQLTDLARALPAGRVEVEGTPEAFVLKAGRSKYELNVYPAEVFPSRVWPLTSIVELDAEVFSKGVSQVIKCAADEEVRPVLTGVLLEEHGEGLRMVATDTYRLGIAEIANVSVFKKGTKVVVPARALDEVVRIAGAREASMIGVALHEDAIEFHLSGTILWSQLIGEPFVDYSRAMPPEFSLEIEVGKEEALEALRRIRVLVRDHTASVKLSPQSEELVMTVVASDAGRGEEVLPARVKGEPIEVAFNPSYLIDGIEAVDDSEVVLKIAGKTKPARLEGVKAKDYSYLLSPIRLP